MTTQTKQIKQLGLSGVHGNTLIRVGGISNNMQEHRRGRKAHKALMIGDHWKLCTDGDLNITTYRRAGKGWEVVGYYLTLAGAFKCMVDAEVRASDLSDLKATIERIEQLKRDIVGLAAG